jgi:hypothetical protein
MSDLARLLTLRGNRCRCAAFALSVALLGSAGCQHRAARPAQSSGISLPGLPFPSLTVTEAKIPSFSRDRKVDPKLLDLDGFFPPGAKRVGPNQRVSLDLAAERRTSFPSTELCPSPNKHFVLFHDGMKRRQSDIFHWLLILKHDAPYPNTIFGTKLAFDASWSEDSRRFAVTHFVGDNSSEVFAVDVADLVRKPIDLRPHIEEHFPPHVASAPMFLKAYRWTREGRLIVRAIGRAQEEPYELFGCEVATAFVGPDGEPKTTFLRGYIKPQEEEP